MKKLIKKLIYNGTLICKTGLHIGGADEGRNLTDIKNLMIRRADNGEPYIPGSSLKGKMRSLVELVMGVPDGYNFQHLGNEVSELFGALENKDLSACPAQLIVRDAHLSANTRRILGGSEYTVTPFAEVKWENTIDRIKGTADNPRSTERVPANSEFDVEFIINIFDGDDEAKFQEILKVAAILLEKDYLGGSGSRGYGKIKFEGINWDAPKHFDLSKLTNFLIEEEKAATTTETTEPQAE